MKLINFIPLLYVPVCIALAWLNYRLIKKGGETGQQRTIRHGINGAVHCIAAGLAWYITKHWQGVIVTLFLANVFFDSALNVFRDGWKNIWYVSPEVSRYANVWEAVKKGKVIDYLEYRAFGFNGVPPNIIYSLSAIILMCV